MTIVEEKGGSFGECLLSLLTRFFVQIRSVITKDSGSSKRETGKKEEEDQDKNVQKIIERSI
ncbi:unnamed protein product [Arabidopsis thaliana]|jgi:hypothetical protein|uniref:Uncharacterized protein n=2 Tax=Arabidopsis thaliana TaxID=3702 RepID=A0A654F4R3_ARATH|nr:uncharacterized protein AT3G02255 [Arabidopsis thaliana]ANM64061.1 hypothetical protein AT3G02255 [Arabidopsis thaliana]CAA0381074.1 unnamed protein product [Arabidopsis thaliana]VYS56038.1 unnamed protein product [Arabidopsis thaliana]|eukprot:NP_001326112.1 hypothetical protein AT3G02255 [Arabidopsis thaliana]